MFGPTKGGSGDSRLEEGRGMEEGVQMQEWPRRRESCDWRMEFG